MGCVELRMLVDIEMTDRHEAQVIDPEGRKGQVVRLASESTNGRVLVRLDDGGNFLLKPSMLEQQPDDTYRLAYSFEELAIKANSSDSEVVIPVIEEQVSVEKRDVERGRFRITKSVSERDVLVDQPLFHEHVEVERVPVNQMVDTPPDVRYEGDTMIVPVLEEVVVVEIRLMVREEIHIRREREEVHEPQHVRLRREDVKIDPIAADTDAEDDANTPSG